MDPEKLEAQLQGMVPHTHREFARKPWPTMACRRSPRVRREHGMMGWTAAHATG